MASMSLQPDPVSALGCALKGAEWREPRGRVSPAEAASSPGRGAVVTHTDPCRGADLLGLLDLTRPTESLNVADGRRETTPCAQDLGNIPNEMIRVDNRDASPAKVRLPVPQTLARCPSAGAKHPTPASESAALPCIRVHPLCTPSSTGSVGASPELQRGMKYSIGTLRKPLFHTPRCLVGQAHFYEGPARRTGSTFVRTRRSPDSPPPNVSPKICQGAARGKTDEAPIIQLLLAPRPIHPLLARHRPAPHPPDPLDGLGSARRHTASSSDDLPLFTGHLQTLPMRLAPAPAPFSREDKIEEETAPARPPLHPCPFRPSDPAVIPSRSPHPPDVSQAQNQGHMHGTCLLLTSLQPAIRPTSDTSHASHPRSAPLLRLSAGVGTSQARTHRRPESPPSCRLQRPPALPSTTIVSSASHSATRAPWISGPQMLYNAAHAAVRNQRPFRCGDVLLLPVLLDALADPTLPSRIALLAGQVFFAWCPVVFGGYSGRTIPFGTTVAAYLLPILDSSVVVLARRAPAYNPAIVTVEMRHRRAPASFNREDEIDKKSRFSCVHAKYALLSPYSSLPALARALRDAATSPRSRLFHAKNRRDNPRDGITDYLPPAARTQSTRQSDSKDHSRTARRSASAPRSTSPKGIVTVRARERVAVTLRPPTIPSTTLVPSPPVRAWDSQGRSISAQSWYNARRRRALAVVVVRTLHTLADCARRGPFPVHPFTRRAPSSTVAATTTPFWAPPSRPDRRTSSSRLFAPRISGLRRTVLSRCLACRAGGDEEQAENWHGGEGNGHTEGEEKFGGSRSNSGGKGRRLEWRGEERRMPGGRREVGGGKAEGMQGMDKQGMDNKVEGFSEDEMAEWELGDGVKSRGRRESKQRRGQTGRSHRETDTRDVRGRRDKGS
ncbi:hypothetical protein DFH06DRAFT_1138624 [Mycena polygramma]|nr:hypothetical protein DFH06DRAFT_1138624 [Mycena polygramma]